MKPNTTAVAVRDTADLATPVVWQPDQNPARVYIARLASGSRPSMCGALDLVSDMLTGGTVEADRLPWQNLRYQHTAALRTALIESGRAPATCNRILAAVRGVLKEAWRLGLMNAEDYTRAADVTAVKSERLPAGRSIKPRELSALFEACAKDTTPAGSRDAALIAVMYAAGLRRAEVEALDVANFDADTGALTVRGGKGNKDRVTYATNGARDAITDWLRVRGLEPGAMFLSLTKSGAITGRRLTAHAMGAVVGRRAKEAGIDHVGCHDFRRSFVSDLLDAGADITTVQRLAGHANVSTTARYDRRGEDAKQRAAAMLAVPYTRRGR